MLPLLAYFCDEAAAPPTARKRPHAALQVLHAALQLLFQNAPVTSYCPAPKTATVTEHPCLACSRRTFEAAHML